MRRWLWAAVALIALMTRAADAENPVPAWTADSRTGCRVWNVSPQANETIVWSGACRDGLAQGRGVVEWYQNGRFEERCECELQDGRLSGRGTYIFANGDGLDGDLNEHGMGHGLFAWASGPWKGDRYDGDFLAGKRTGHGIYTFANGNRYEGEFLDGIRSGSGSYVWPTGSHYDGQWADDKANGLAWISQTRRCIGAENLRKVLCHNNISQLLGAPRCRQSVRRRCSNLKQ